MDTPNDRTQPLQADTRHDTDVRHAERDDLRVEHHPETTQMPVAAERAAYEPVRTRGGVSFWSVLSGVLVAFGAFVVLSAVIGAVMAATGVTEGGISSDEISTATIGAGVGLVLAQFLAYLWGGYTAGRMARGAGVGNGVLVAVLGLIFVAVLGAILALVAGTTPDTAAADAQRLPLPLNAIADIGTSVGIGVLVAMLLGGALGGLLGQRWHTKLENGQTRYTH